MLISNITFLIFAVLVVRRSHCRPYKPFSTVKFFTLIMLNNLPLEYTKFTNTVNCGTRIRPLKGKKASVINTKRGALPTVPGSETAVIQQWMYHGQCGWFQETLANDVKFWWIRHWLRRHLSLRLSSQRSSRGKSTASVLLQLEPHLLYQAIVAALRWRHTASWLLMKSCSYVT